MMSGPVVFPEPCARQPPTASVERTHRSCQSRVAHLNAHLWKSTFIAHYPGFECCGCFLADAARHLTLATHDDEGMFIVVMAARTRKARELPQALGGFIARDTVQFRARRILLPVSSDVSARDIQRSRSWAVHR
jgi:hypothetical protein